MRDHRSAFQERDGQTHLSDDDLLVQFHQDPQQAWQSFIDKYAALIFSLLGGMGFDYDGAMDRFVYLCEKLSEKDFRRMKAIRHTGSQGEIVPWLRQVVKRLCINWAWSEDGRRRLLKPIQKMSAREQRVFELYFWRGFSPVSIEEQLRLEHFDDVTLGDVFAALDRIHSELSEKKIWRLVSNLMRSQRMVALDDPDAEPSASLEPVTMALNPESLFARKEQAEQIRNALASLSTREALMIQLRYDDAASVAEIAAVMKLTASEVRKELELALTKVRRRVV